MKKYLAGLLIGLAAFALAGEARAAFDWGNLIRVVYDTTGNVEVATDLGSITTWTSPASIPTQTLGGGAAAFNLGMFGSGASWDNLRIAYFAVDNTAAENGWTSGPLDGTQTSGNRQFGPLKSGFDNVSNYYKTLPGTTGTVSAVKSYDNSYWNIMDKNGVGVGTFNGFIPLGGGEISLAALGTTGYVEQALYFFDFPNSVNSGVQLVTIRTMADGSTQVINPVPVPPSVLLLGSGILGLIGFRSRVKNPLAS